MKTIDNMHVLTVKYSGATNTRGSRISIRSDRFKKSKIISYNYDFNNSLDSAIDHLTKQGFNVIGKGEGKGVDYIISDTFQSL